MNPNMLSNSKPFMFGVMVLFLIANGLVKGWNIDYADVWNDEAFTIFHSQGSVENLIKALLADPNPPLHNLFIKFWTNIFGIGAVAVRVPSLIFSLMSSLLLFKLANRFFNFQTSVLASYFYLISFVHLMEAVHARSYALSSTLCLISFYTFFDLFERQRKTSAIVLGVVSWLLIFNHYTNFLIFITQAVCSFLWSKDKKIGFKYYWISQVTAALLFMPWVYLFITEGLLAKSGLPFKDRGAGDISRVPGALVANKTVWWTFVILIFPSIFYIRKFKTYVPDVGVKRMLVLLSWALATVLLAWVLSPVSDFFNPNYLMYASFAFWLLIGYTISILSWSNVAKWVVMCYFLIVAIWDFRMTPIQRENWTDVISILKDKRMDNSVVLLSPSYHSLPFIYHYRKDWVRLGHYPTVERLMLDDGIYFIRPIAKDRNAIARKLTELQVDNVVLLQTSFRQFDEQRTFPELLQADFVLDWQTEIDNALISVFSSKNESRTSYR